MSTRCDAPHFLSPDRHYRAAVRKLVAAMPSTAPATPRPDPPLNLTSVFSPDAGTARNCTAASADIRVLRGGILLHLRSAAVILMMFTYLLRESRA
ncbi:hypothetical protein [Streptomyces chartreusis]|uniref:hypothetical protein n=1 Tax=Streptomyces chartreusis TaxID=1969 RepID=UPI0036DBEAF5